MKLFRVHLQGHKNAQVTACGLKSEVDDKHHTSMQPLVVTCATCLRVALGDARERDRDAIQQRLTRLRVNQ